MNTATIDELDKQILRLISKDARIPFLEVARECNVSGAAIHQRIQKLKDAGVIKGSEFVIDSYKIGYQTCAYIGIILNNSKLLSSVADELRKIPQIVECHCAIGKYTLFVKLLAYDNLHLSEIITQEISSIQGVIRTETFQISLNQLINRQLTDF